MPEMTTEAKTVPLGNEVLDKTLWRAHCQVADPCQQHICKCRTAHVLKIQLEASLRTENIKAVLVEAIGSRNYIGCETAAVTSVLALQYKPVFRGQRCAR